MRLFILCVLFLCCASANQASAVVFGGSNLPVFGYSKPSCYLYSSPSKYDVERYIDCINEYVENANNDIKRIREAAEEAVNDAKSNLRTLTY